MAKRIITLFIVLFGALSATGAIIAPAVSQEVVEQLPVVKQFRINIKDDCGAKGDGKTNDSAAFRKAAQLLQENGGGTLVIPQSTYIVGEQIHIENEYPYYKFQPVLQISKVNGVVIEGNGATLKLADGLRFGAFDKDSGEVFHHALPFMDTRYNVGVGTMVQISHSENVVIRNLELDGNSSNLQLGGLWGDKGRQCWGYGLYLGSNRNVFIHNLHSHRHALDGAIIGYYLLKENDPPTPVTITDSVFEYNARQGLSWVGGRGMKVYRSKFNHTGRTLNNGQPLASAPGAGLDIEAEESVTRDGYFEDCEFINNTGCGMVADTGDGGYATFKNCTFWGTTSWSVWPRKPGLKFEGSRFYGSAVHMYGSPNPELATQWINCTFEDKPWTDGKVYRGNSNKFLLEMNGNMENVVLKDCDFIANTCRSVWVDCTPGKSATFDGCTFLHQKTDLPNGDWQGLMRNANLVGCHFREEFAADVTANWFIINDKTTVAGQPTTIVDGPRIKWSGRTGVIPPTP